MEKGFFGYGTGHELGFYAEFPKGDEYVVVRVSGLGTPGCMLTVSRELEPIICGISETKDVPYQTLLVLPAETIETAGNDISDMTLLLRQNHFLNGFQKTAGTKFYKNGKEITAVSMTLRSWMRQFCIVSQ
ncbi:MAG: hypothetical protein ACOX8K_14925 [Lachnospiraceae bacterium]|jgi:hypothetical protein